VFGVQRELYRNATIEVRYLNTCGLELPVQYRRNFMGVNSVEGIRSIAFGLKPVFEP
jgi:hypothetical protein